MKRKTLVSLLLCALLLAGCAGREEGIAPPENSSVSSGSAAPDGSGAPEDTSPPSAGVRVDWSRLDGPGFPVQPDVDGGRWYPGFTGQLIPRNDYGPLVPFLGGQAYSFQHWEFEGEQLSYYSDWPTPFYGLMTREGKIVVDPVFQSAWQYSYSQNRAQKSLPVLVLGRSDPAYEGFGEGMRYAVAAEDGSWCTEFEFLSYANRDDRLFLMGTEGCTMLNSVSGARQDWSWEELGIDAGQVPYTLSFVQWTVGLNWMEQGVCLGCLDEDVDWSDLQLRIFDPDRGEITLVPQEQYDEWYSAWSDARWGAYPEIVREGNQTGLRMDGVFYPLDGVPLSSFVSDQAGDFITTWISDDGGYRLYRISTGELLRKSDNLELLPDPARPGTVAVLLHEKGSCQILGAGLQPLLTLPPAASNVWIYASLRDGLLSFRYEGNFFGCYDLERGEYIFFRNLGLGD